MLANAVAFSSLISIAPLLYIALGFAGMAIGGDAGRADVIHELGRWIGDDGAGAIFSIIDRIGTHGGGTVARIAGAIFLVYAATRLFSQMKTALDHMWDVHPKSGKGWRARSWKQIRKRGFAILLVLFVGMQIIAVVAVKTFLAASTTSLGDAVSHAIFRFFEIIISLATTTLTFAALFKVLPDVKLAWRDAWRGAFVTAVLFSLGASVVGIYLGHKALAENYGPAASIILVLLWVHYCAQVFFFGAAVTGELAKRRGAPIEPDDHGIRIVVRDGETR
jgi:membrane protein